MKNVFEFKVQTYSAYDMRKFLENFKCFYDNGEIFYCVNKDADVIKVKRENPNEFVWRYLTRNNARVIRVENKVVPLNRIVAEQFVQCYVPPAHYAEIRHKDGNKKNCAADNLCWVSRNKRVSNYNQEHKLDIMLKKLNKIAREDNIEIDDVEFMKLED